MPLLVALIHSCQYYYWADVKNLIAGLKMAEPEVLRTVACLSGLDRHYY